MEIEHEYVNPNNPKKRRLKGYQKVDNDLRLKLLSLVSIC